MSLWGIAKGVTLCGSAMRSQYGALLWSDTVGQHFGVEGSCGGDGQSALHHLSALLVSWRGLRRRRIANVIPSPRRAVRRIQELLAASLSRVPGKGYGADCPEEITQRVWDSRGIRNSQRGLVKGRACLTNLISFCNGRTAWGVRERLLM